MYQTGFELSIKATINFLLTAKTECHNPTSLFGSRTLIIISPKWKRKKLAGESLTADVDY